MPKDKKDIEKDVKGNESKKNPKDMGDFDKVIDADLARTIYGAEVDDDDLERHFSSLDGTISQRLRKLNDDTFGSIASLLQNNDKSFSEEDKKTIEEFNKELSSGVNMNMVAELFATEFENAHYFVNFETLKTFIPDLKAAHEDMKNSILYPESYMSEFSDYVKHDKATSDPDISNEVIDNYKRNIESKYDLEENVEKMVDIALEKGKAYVLTRPYDHIFTNIINKRDSKSDGFVNESMFLKSDYNADVSDIINESFYSMKDDISRVSDTKSSDISKDIDLAKSYMEAFAANLKIYDNNTTGVMVNEMTTMSQFMTESTSDVSAFSDGMVTSNKQRIESLGLNEAYFEVIGPQYLLPIKVNKTILGYYYVETRDEVNRIRSMSDPNKNNGVNFGKSLGGNRQGNNTFNLGNFKSPEAEEDFFNGISEIILAKLDKKFLKDNDKFKKELYDILKHNDNYKREMRISFIEKEYIEEVCINDGDGMFKYSITLAKSYVALLITYMMLKITRSRDQLLYYVKQSAVTSDISKSLNSAIRSIKRANWDMKDILTGGVEKLYRVGDAQFSKQFIPVSKDGNKAIDVEILSGQDTTIKDELLEELLTLIRNSTGVPSVILNFVNEADYAKTLVMANQRYARTIFGHQKSLNRALTNIYRKLLKYEDMNSSKGEDSAKIDYMDFYVELPAPVSLLMTVLADNFTIQDSTVRSALACVFGQSPTDKEAKVQEKVYGDIMRSRMSSFGDLWEDIDASKKKHEMLLQEEDINEPENPEDINRDVY